MNQNLKDALENFKIRIEQNPDSNKWGADTIIITEQQRALKELKRILKFYDDNGYDCGNRAKEGLKIIQEFIKE